jgi:hypothetical protein
MQTSPAAATVVTRAPPGQASVPSPSSGGAGRGPGGRPLPPHFFEADAAELVELAAESLDRILAHNDRLPLRAAEVTRFHAQAPAPIAVRDYLRRIIHYCAVEKACVLAMLVYMDRVRGAPGGVPTRAPPAPAPGARGPPPPAPVSGPPPAPAAPLVVSSLTVHRIAITAIVIATKTVCDACYTNDHYARVGGITRGELNILEVELLQLLGWRSHVTPETLQTYYANLCRTTVRWAPLARAVLVAPPADVAAAAAAAAAAAPARPGPSRSPVPPPSSSSLPTAGAASGAATATTTRTPSPVPPLLG